MANNGLLATESMGGALGSNWTAVNTLSKCQVTGGVAEPNTLSVEAGQVYTGVAFPNDHISEASITISQFDAGSNFSLAARIQSGAYSGYKATIGNNAATIYRVDAGVATSLVASGAIGGTWAIGDVWQFMAAGSVFTLYLNGKRIIYAADDTYTGGSPGFLQFSSTAIANTQGKSWRGYNAIQQDGIWQKQPIIIPLKAADVANTGFGVWNPSWVDQGPAVLLSGTVYRMLFNGGGQNASNQGATFYAESANGETGWTRQGSAVISNFTIEAVAFSGGTYYGFGQTGQAQGSGPVNIYTSTDLRTWTLAASSVLTLGSAGAWDESQLYVQANPVNIAGTWYLLYGGAPNPNTPIFYKSGIATATNLLGPWTKYAGNPVLPAGVSGPLLGPINGRYYTWTASGPGPNNTRISGNAFNPTETIRYSSADLLTWDAVGVRSLHASQLSEMVNGVNGGSTSSIIVNIGGKAHNYYAVSANDSANPHDYQISLAIGPAPIEQIALKPEDGTVQKATDAFPGANGDLSGSWATPAGGTKLTIVSNRVRATSTAAYDVMYNSAVVNADHYSEITVPTLADANSFAVPAVRVQAGSNSGYAAQIQGALGTLQTGGTGIIKLASGTASVMTGSSLVACRAAAGDVFRLAVNTVNSLPVISLFQNGALIQQYVDLANTFTTGQPGMGINTGTLANTEISLWSSGSAGSVPTYPGGTGTADDMLSINRWCSRLWG